MRYRAKRKRRIMSAGEVEAAPVPAVIGEGVAGEALPAGTMGDVTDGDRRRRNRWNAAKEAFTRDHGAQLACGWYTALDWLPYSSACAYTRFAARFGRAYGFTEYTFTPPYGGARCPRVGSVWARDKAAALQWLLAGLATSAGPVFCTADHVRTVAAWVHRPEMLWFDGAK